MNPARPPFLGDLELAVMDHLWSHDPSHAPAHAGSDAKAVHRAVGRNRRITLNTIQSTLKRLFEKGLLDRQKVSHAHLYSPCITRDEFHRDALQQVVDRLMGGEPSAMLSAFVGLTEQVGVGELEQLERLLAQRLEQRKGEQRR